MESADEPVEAQEPVAIASTLQAFHAVGRALCHRPLRGPEELEDAGKAKARWGVDVTMFLHGMAGRDAAMAFVEAGRPPDDDASPGHERSVRVFREVMLAQVLHLEQLIGPHP